MKPQAHRPSLQALGLFRAIEKSIISAGENAADRQRHSEFETVPNDALEHCSLLCANRRDAGCRAKTGNRALQDLSATCLRVDRPSLTFFILRVGSHTGFCCYAP